MNIPICLFTILAACGIMHVASSNVQRKNEKKVKDFLKEQSAVYIVPKEKMDEIKFLKTEIAKMHLKPKSDKAKNAIKNLMAYDNMQVANFEGLSNEDLKKKYGSNNFKDVLSYQNNFDSLLKDLISSAELLVTDKDNKGAIALLNYSLSLGNNITKNYTLLADIYEEENMRKELFDLVDLVRDNKDLSQQKIMSYIQSKQKGDL